MAARKTSKLSSVTCGETWDGFRKEYNELVHGNLAGSNNMLSKPEKRTGFWEGWSGSFNLLLYSNVWFLIGEPWFHAGCALCPASLHVLPSKVWTLLTITIILAEEKTFPLFTTKILKTWRDLAALFILRNVPILPTYLAFVHFTRSSEFKFNSECFHKQMCSFYFPFSSQPDIWFEPRTPRLVFCWSKFQNRSCKRCRILRYYAIVASFFTLPLS